MSDAGGAGGRGRVLAGRYRLVRPLAEGGMAAVWEARDEILARSVAVKIPHARLAADPTFRERFRREAVAAARLAHPGIVATYDTGSDGPTDFIVMELVRGRTVRDLVAEGPVPAEVAVPLVAQVAEALDAAHRAGIIHRDIKPANLLLIEDGPAPKVKVADFGVARATEIVEAQGGAGDVTREGLVVGTARYVAPEQVAAGSLDGRTDLYAVGCVLHELLAGRPPFSRDTDLANALAHLTEAPPSLSSLGIAVSPALERLVLACLAKDPAARPASALLLAQQLRALPTGPPTAAVPVVEAAGATLVAAGAPLGAGMLPGPPAATAAWAAGARPGRALPAVPPPPAALRPPAAPRTAPPPPDRRTGTPARRHGTRTVRRPSRSRAPLVVVGGLVMAALVTALLVVSRPPPPAASGASPAASTATNRPVVADVSSFDPEADGQENDPQLPRLTDGNPATTWSSDRYNLRPAFGNLKKGVGVVVALDRPSALDRLRVRSPSRGWAAQVYVARSPASTLAGWGQPVARATGVQGDLDVALTGRSGGAVLVWFTDPGRTGQVVVGELELT